MTGADELRTALARATTASYRNAGLFAHRFANGKLMGDPAYMGILERGLLPDSARLIDLGCGQGLLAAWLFAARALCDDGKWPAALPRPPRVDRFTGIELMEKDVARARDAMGSDPRAEFIAGDLRTADLGVADAAVILDVLHYMDFADQDAVLRRVRNALAPSSGTLLMRVGDAAGGWRFEMSRWVDHAVTSIRGHRLSKLHCRTLSEWKSALASLGFTVDACPMSAGTLFANVLLAGRLR